MTHARRLPIYQVLRGTCAAIIMASVCLATPAQAQFRLPRVTLPSLPNLPPPPQVPVPQELPRLPPAPGAGLLPNPVPLQMLRQSTVRELLRLHANVLEADPAGEPVRRQELLLLSPTRVVLDAAIALGFVVLREQTLPELELQQVVLRPPQGLSTAQALARLRAVDPQVEADFNHVYTRSGETSLAVSPASDHAATRRRVGLVDSGLDRRHASLRGADVRVWGCNDVPTPSPHGTAVASLLVGRDAAFAGVATASVLYAADIYCGQPAGGAAENIASALAWMAREQVAVVNISLVGPPNLLLERVVRAMSRKGHLLVAAVGNDGPAAPPLYPSAYPGVVGVTAVSSARRVLPEAAQGPQVMFAAPGADLVVAQAGVDYSTARGTSFAAPIVAGLLAESMRAPDPAAAAAALAYLAANALDLGAAGRDPVYGIGLVGERPPVAR